jgi:dipeptidyl aminopeptidase/acylaminoacyl peptidase
MRRALATVTMLLIGTHAQAASPTHAAFLTFESGVLVAVDWMDRDGDTVHSHALINQSMILDADIQVRPDGSTGRSTVTATNAGESRGKPIEHAYDPGTVCWNDYMTGSIQLVIDRARVLNVPDARIPAASLFSATKGEILVARHTPTDWVVSYHNKRYDVLTDEQGNVLTASLPDYGVTVERRDAYAPDRYPPWPPNAAPPDKAYRAVPVRIPAPEGHVLAGTLTLPNKGRPPFPAAVLITGLSANNRNGGEPPWMPLHDLADALTRAGIAVLRVDDRGVEESTGNRDSSTTYDEANDVQTEVAYLKARHDIAKHRIALVGYSEGGLIAPMVASRDSSIAAIVTLAGPGVPGLEVGRYQIEAAVSRDSTIAPADREAEIQKQLADSTTPRERTYLGIDPLPYARRVRCPALVLQGGSDMHVPPRSAERLASAMREGGNPDVSVRLFPGVSHCLAPDPNGLSSGWAMLPALRLKPELLDAMTDWTRAHLSR